MDHDTNDAFWTPLSPAGRRRRDAILSAALAEANGRRGRRRFAMSAVAGMFAAAVGVVAVVALRPDHPVPQQVHKSNGDETMTDKPELVPSPTSVPAVAAPPVRPQAVVIDIIRTDPTIVDRLAVPVSPGGWETIGTDELLWQLDQLGLSGGVVMRNGKPQIWFRPADGPG